MGIRGLTSWLHGCASAFTETIHLQNCDLILDAVGVAFDLLSEVQEQLADHLRKTKPCSCQQSCHCIDMMVQAMTDTGAIWPYYVETVAAYFGQLQLCVGQTGSIVSVLDGCTPLSKLNTWATRARASHAAARKLSVELLHAQGSCVSAWSSARLERRVQGRSRGVHMRPGLLSAAFAQACRVAGIQLVKAKGEADDAIMDLLLCDQPLGGSTRRVVVSNDSDFMAQPITAHGCLGMVYPAELKACVTKHHETGEACRVLAFRHDRMVRVMQLPSAAAPLLGACLGNDAYDPAAPVRSALLLACTQSASSKQHRSHNFTSVATDPPPPSVDAICALLRRCVMSARGISMSNAPGSSCDTEDAQSVALALLAAVGKALVRIPCLQCSSVVGANSSSAAGKTRRKKRNFQRANAGAGKRPTAAVRGPLEWTAVEHSFLSSVAVSFGSGHASTSVQPDRSDAERITCPVVTAAVHRAQIALAQIPGLHALCDCARRHLLDFSVAVQLCLVDGQGSALLDTVHPFPCKSPQEAVQHVAQCLTSPTLLLDGNGHWVVLPRKAAPCIHPVASAAQQGAAPPGAGKSTTCLSQLLHLTAFFIQSPGEAQCARALAIAEQVGLLQTKVNHSVGLDDSLDEPLGFAVRALSREV